MFSQGKSEEIAKAMKLDVKTVKSILGEEEKEFMNLKRYNYL